MAKSKKVTAATDGGQTVTTNVEATKKTDSVIYFKALRGLTVDEHKAISEKLRFEEAATGLKIVLVPVTLEVVDGQ
jgi:hypothetical protein